MIGTLKAPVLCPSPIPSTPQSVPLSWLLTPEIRPEVFVNAVVLTVSLLSLSPLATFIFVSSSSALFSLLCGFPGCGRATCIHCAAGPSACLQGTLALLNEAATNIVHIFWCTYVHISIGLYQEWNCWVLGYGLVDTAK